MKIITHVIDAAHGKHPIGTARSDHWPVVRKAHLKDHPDCAVCGGNEKLQVHHIRPFHIHPELELEPTNLVTLCESGGSNCHLLFGHLKNFKSFNVNVLADSALWLAKIMNRPNHE